MSQNAELDGPIGRAACMNIATIVAGRRAEAAQASARLAALDLFRSTIDAQLGSSNKGGVIAEEKKSRCGNFFRLGHAAERDR